MRALRTFTTTLLALALGFGCKQPEQKEGGPEKTAEKAPEKAAGNASLVKIVSSLPRTGSANAQTTTMVNGIRMAIDEIGAKVGSFQIAYEDWDDASAKKGDWDPEVEAQNAARAVKDPDVMFYIGTYNSGAAKISMPVLNQAQLTMISPGNTYPGLTKPGMGEPNEPMVYRPSGKVTYFRVVPADDIQGKVAAEWIKQMGGKTVYVLDDRGLYGKGVADVFAATAGEIGLNVLGHEGIDPKAQEYRGLMTKVKEKNPDWVYFGGTTQSNAGQIAKDLVAVGLKSKLMLPDGCYENAFIEAAGADNANDRVYLTFGGFPPDKLAGKGAEFVVRYREKYKAEPEAYAVYGYVATQAALDALRKVNAKDRAALAKAVAETKQVDGALGTWQFDENGDTSLKTMSGNIVKNGKFEFVTQLGGSGTETAEATPQK
jgi:branched-chain amino acid transport system substrate-binding protein